MCTNLGARRIVQHNRARERKAGRELADEKENVVESSCALHIDACLRCQAENKREVLGRQDCVVVWGECNHSFHHCCMSLWVKQNNRCPLCQQEWSIQRMGK
ncbi:RING-box protein 2 isoform X2 [Rhagoletis pomonella]|uniref:RING-box protein 2 isoform X2 n=1 Tax=Rhagoletis pomonella TaxID=28610 RepID=UPI00177F3C50|nr:RING-box protein 2 isoform X2 [Rhagoletis pomonella]